MNFEIDQISLLRIGLIARKKECAPEELLPEILQKGLNIIEIQSDREPALVNHFISENRDKMNDSQMAGLIGIPIHVVAERRRGLGLLRARGRSARLARISAVPIVSSALSEEQEKYISMHLTDSDSKIVARLKVHPSVIVEFREKLAAEYIPDHYLEENDGNLGKQFGLTFPQIVAIRRKLKSDFLAPRKRSSLL